MSNETITLKNNYNKNAIKNEIYIIIIPMIIENILVISANLVITAMVGRLLTDDISAQGICNRITDTLWCFYKGVAIGATVLIARQFGAGYKKDCRLIAEQTLITEFIIVFFVQMILFFKAPLFLGFFSDDTNIISKAWEYMRIVIFGFPFLVIMTIVTASFQGHGDTKTPMMIAIFVNIINIILGYSLIFGILSFKGLGIRGAAISIIVSQMCGAILGLFLLYRNGGLYGNKIKDYKFFTINRHYIYEIYTLGIPAALESMFWQFSAIILSKIILSYGAQSFAAYQLGIQAETITEMPAIGFSTASTTLTAKAIGQKDETLRKAYFKEMLKIGICISSITSLLLIFLPSQFMSIMTDKLVLQKIGIVYVFIMGFIQMPQNLSRIYNGCIRSMGYKLAPMLVTGFGIWIFRIPLSFLVAYIFKLPLIFIWIIIAGDQLTRFILSLVIYFTVNKKRIKI